MDSRSAMTSRGVCVAPQPLIAQHASRELRKPRAQPEPVGQNGCGKRFAFSFMPSFFLFVHHIIVEDFFFISYFVLIYC